MNQSGLHRKARPPLNYGTPYRSCTDRRVLYLEVLAEPLECHWRARQTRVSDPPRGFPPSLIKFRLLTEPGWPRKASCNAIDLNCGHYAQEIPGLDFRRKKRLPRPLAVSPFRYMSGYLRYSAAYIMRLGTWSCKDGVRRITNAPKQVGS